MEKQNQEIDNIGKKPTIPVVIDDCDLRKEMVKKFPFIKEAKGYLTIKTKLNKQQEKNHEEFKQAWRNIVSELNKQTIIK